MATIPAQNNFEISQDGGTYHFTYRYSQPSKPVLIFNTVLLAFIAYSANSVGGFFSLFGLAVFVAGIYYFYFSKKSDKFSITPTEFIVNGNHHNRQSISSVYVKAPRGLETQRRTGFSVGSPALAAGATFVAGTAAQSLGAANARAGQKIRYKVCFQKGGREVTLAKRLSSQAANQLFDKVIEVAKS